MVITNALGSKTVFDREKKGLRLQKKCTARWISKEKGNAGGARSTHGKEREIVQSFVSDRRMLIRKVNSTHGESKLEEVAFNRHGKEKSRRLILKRV